jgi:hypothetical protein
MKKTRDEAGIAMITAILVITIVTGLTAVVLTTGSHSDRSSQRGRNWTVALQTADSGIQRVIAYMQATNGGVPGCVSVVTGVPCSSVPGTTADGTYNTVVTPLGRHRYQIDSTAAVGAGAGMVTSRSVRVVMGPPKSFRYALFSLTDVDTKNNNLITGDVWANGNVAVQNGDTVNGSATAATGWILLNNGSHVTGSAVSGGYNASNGRAIDVSTNASIGGTAKAESTAPDCSDDPTHLRYNVNVDGTISGAVTAWGSKTGGGSTGVFTSLVCLAAPASQPLPAFTYNPVNYSPAPTEFATPTAFNTWLAAGHTNGLSGTYYIHGGGAGDPVNIGGVTIGGDTTIIAESAPIDASTGIGDANATDKVLVLVSYYQPAPGSACTDNGGNPADCAVGIKNNFQLGSNTSTLIYAPNGPVAFKNNTDFYGAVYANDIVLKNNLHVVYDPRVDQIVGYGPVTLQTESWTETTH